MNLVINYDLFKEIYNAKEPSNIFKIIKNQKKKWFLGAIPILIVLDYQFNEGISEILEYFPLQFFIVIGGDIIVQKMFGDIPKEKAVYRLKHLISELQNLEISTDYDLLLESYIYIKKYSIKFNKYYLPYILEEKYINIPTYGFDGEINETSVLQEHIIGSSDYVLSLGSPSKSLKLAYSNS